MQPQYNVKIWHVSLLISLCLVWFRKKSDHSFFLPNFLNKWQASGKHCRVRSQKALKCSLQEIGFKDHCFITSSILFKLHNLKLIEARGTTSDILAFYSLCFRACSKQCRYKSHHLGNHKYSLRNGSNLLTSQLGSRNRC